MPIVGGRFDFGSNWRRFLGSLTPERIEVAERSLQDAFGCESLAGRRFLDVGCGSGLFSLAASRLGADVHSFDFNPVSVACAETLRERYPPRGAWTIEQGDALSPDYMASLEPADIVYSWGVLHHTGDQWSALRNVLLPLAPGGLLYLALYRRKGWKTPVWSLVKRAYCSGPLGQALVLGTFVPGIVVHGALADALTRPRVSPTRRYRDYYRERGMSPVWDWVDWLGGHPYETSTPAEVIAHYERAGLQLVGCRLVESSMGNHEYLFTADASAHVAGRERPWRYWAPTPEAPLPPDGH